MTPNYKISVVPLADREALIINECASAQRTHRFHEYRSTREDLKVIRLAINIPIYRVANYRTSIQQMKWIREKNTTPKYFSGGEENDSVQRIQHSFLWNLALTEKESISSIVERLRVEKQRDPILISSSGVVVNGNRRLSAMRELMMEDQEFLESFSFIDCMVLPQEATEDDMKEIEVRLQMTPETRLPYDWISECIAIKDLTIRGKSFDLIGNLMRLDPPKVKEKLQMLNEIDLYLNEWKNRIGDYDSILDGEEIISQITRRLNRKEGLQQEIARRFGWILLDQRGKEGRVYDLREVTGNLSNIVINKILEEYSDLISSDSSNQDGELILEIPDVAATPEQGMLSFLETTRNNEGLQQEIVDKFKVVVEAQKTQKIGNAALLAIRDAHTKLEGVDVTTADRGTIEPMLRQLASIEQRVDHLKGQLNQIKSIAAS
ncbi:MAG TPA: hypothetical protein VHE34_08765 [Puia sp.]|uniref:hypothetical protein n=1 Tax=Puia sp. TaxID=2045100 RepID=UPI002C8DAD4F|nr:hypothetical protein [Puia sp.]HVU95302.1 hypothetical protein [Puia sp.]